jgi:phage terminase Nu1 subunit (DNA packaging protein)
MTGDAAADVRFPSREPERYVDRRQLAAIMRVSLATVDRLVSEGMPSETWGRRTRRFRPSVALAWARSRSCDNHDTQLSGARDAGTSGPLTGT